MQSDSTPKKSKEKRMHQIQKGSGSCLFPSLESMESEWDKCSMTSQEKSSAVPTSGTAEKKHRFFASAQIQMGVGINVALLELKKSMDKPMIKKS